MKFKTDLEAIEHAMRVADGVFSDSVRYPQLRLPDRQHEQIKNLLFDLHEHVIKHPMRRKTNHHPMSSVDCRP